MGGLHTEISGTSTDIVIEAAHFSATGIARESRRHNLVSEASKRFERGVDRELPPAASWRAVRLLAELGGAVADPGVTHAQVDVAPVRITIPAGHPDRVAGVTYGRETVIRRLEQVGCVVTEGAAASPRSAARAVARAAARAVARAAARASPRPECSPRATSPGS